MRFISGSITVTASEPGLCAHANINAKDKVLSFVIQNRCCNGLMYVGHDTGVVATDGWTLTAGSVSPTVNFRDVGGSVTADTIHFHAATACEVIDFQVILL